MKKVKDIFRDLGDAKRILRELKLLRHFRPHENVVTILDIMVYPVNSIDFRCERWCLFSVFRARRYLVSRKNTS